MPLFERVAVLGLGLLGGSVALAARSRGVAGRVLGATRRRDVLEAALERGAIDEAGDAEQVAAAADLVVLATPLHAMPERVSRIAPVLPPESLLTDVGSVKLPLAETLPGLLPPGAHYVGAHPMAGSHRTGFEHARADLFEGAPCIVTSGAPTEAVERVAAFWRALGAEVVHREAAQHDAEVAWVSHLPHLLAFGFAAALRGAPPGALELAGPGFRDFTRIAQADPELWADILVSNAKAVSAPLQAICRSLEQALRLLEAGDSEELRRLVAAGRSQLPGAEGPRVEQGVPASATHPNPRSGARPSGARSPSKAQ